MATLISGLGGTAGYGENSFRTTPLTAGNLDDGSTQVSLTSVFGAGGINVYGTSYTSVFVNSNGNLTFGGANTTFNPTALTAVGRPIIAGFWTDIDINKGGEIYWDLDPANGRMIITWAAVAPFTVGPGRNSFQIVLTNTAAGDLSVEYIYETIGFTNGNGGTAVVGLSNGTSSQILAEGSGNAAFMSGYPTNNFDTGDPNGIFGFNFEGGQPFAGDGIVDGTAGNDSIGAAYTGDPGGDRIDNNDATGFSGTTGNDDYVRAAAGNDTVASGLGNDHVFGGTGSDSISGGSGTDTLEGDEDGDTLDGGSGNDTLYGGDGADTLIGGVAQAAVTYTPTYTEITTATQTVTGTNGRPNFAVQTLSNEANLTLGTNGTVSGFNLGNGDANETHTHTMSSQVTGGQILFNAVDTGEVLTIVLDGVTLDLTTAVANGTVTLGGFPATYQLNGSGQIIRAGASVTTVGTVTINVPFTSVALVGSGTSGTPGLFYELYVNTNPPNLAAEAGGNDQLFGGAGNDLLQGGDGNDTLSGGADNDTLDGGTGADSLSGDAGLDTLTGGDGNDTLAGGAEGDLLDGGIGTDLLSGDAGADTLFGGADADTLSGGTENDSLLGDAGTDVLFGDAGADTLSGGTENDTLFGGTENDSLSGDAGNDSLAGDAGNDTLFGGADNDTLRGGADNDSLSGDAGADSLVGDAGNDTLTGGAGNDTLTGGAGDDRFVWNGTSNNDLITDFNTGNTGSINDLNQANNDFVDLSGIFSNATLAAYNLANGTSFKLPIQALNHDLLGTGVISFNGTTMSGPTLTLTGITGGLTFDQTNVTCFTAGTMIETAHGPRAVDSLLPGDLVLTRDHGVQPLRWIGTRRLGLAEQIASPALRPVRIAAGALSPWVPACDTLVSPQHRVLIEGVAAEMLFGEAEVLVAARHLMDGARVTVAALAEVTYVHLLFDRHEIVQTAGMWSESFQPAARSLGTLAADQRAEIATLFPDITPQTYPAARPTLKAHEAKVLLAG
jgi:Ca2+-binding RTX toxin-like protein